MSDMMTIWRESKMAELEELVELEAAKDAVLPKRHWKKALAFFTVCVGAAIPALAIAASNGYFEDPTVPQPEVQSVTPTVNSVMVRKDETPTVVVPVTVTAKPKKVAYKGPRTCKSRGLELIKGAGNVVVCARPASADPTRERSTKQLVSFWR